MPRDYEYNHVVEVGKIPKTEHYVVLEETSVSGDDGWGENTTTKYLSYVALNSAEDLQKYIEATEARNSQSYGSKTVYQVIRAIPLTVKKTLTIEVK